MTDFVQFYTPPENRLNSLDWNVNFVSELDDIWKTFFKERFHISRRDDTEFFLNLIKCEISNVKLRCQLDFIVMNFVEQFKQNWKKGNFWWNLQLCTVSFKEMRTNVCFLLPTANTAVTKPRNHAFLFPQCDKHPAPSYLLSTDPRYRYCAVIASLGLAFPWVSAVWSVSLLRPKDLPWSLPPFFLLFLSVPTNESRPSSEVAQKNP